MSQKSKNAGSSNRNKHVEVGLVKRLRRCKKHEKSLKLYGMDEI